jgi:hypothetical protein
MALVLAAAGLQFHDSALVALQDTTPELYQVDED